MLLRARQVWLGPFAHSAAVKNSGRSSRISVGRSSRPTAAANSTTLDGTRRQESAAKNSLQNTGC